nr:sulfotransferase [Pseudoalteromonas luteoviolacea]
MCIASLNIGLKTAHTAYTQNALITAEFIADTPIFNDYMKLYKAFPNAKLVYLERDLAQWVPSIRRLLQRMLPKLQKQGGGFNDTLKRCYFETFPNLNEHLLNDDGYLIECYNAHHKRFESFIEMNDVEYLKVNLSDPNSNTSFAKFMSVPSVEVPHVNKRGKVTAWNDIKHPLKVESTRNGKVDKDSSLYLFNQ